MEGSVIVNCRNFECGFNRSGKCSSERIELTAQGGIIDQLRCVEAFRREIKPQAKVDNEGGSECKNTEKV